MGEKFSLHTMIYNADKELFNFAKIKLFKDFNEAVKERNNVIDELQLNYGFMDDDVNYNNHGKNVKIYFHDSICKIRIHAI